MNPEEEYLRMMEASARPSPRMLEGNINVPSFPAPTQQVQDVRQRMADRPMGSRAEGIVGAVGGLLGKLGRAVYGNDDITRLRRQNAFQAMTLNPNQALITSNAAQIQRLQDQELLKGQASRTAQWLRSMGTDISNKYANYLEQNPGADVANVLKMWDTERKEGATETETIRTRMAEAEALGYLPGTQEYNNYIAEGQGSRLSKDEKISTENNLRASFRQDLNQFDFFTVRDGFETVKEFYNKPGEVSDYSLTVAFLKVLDPGSVVRGEEVTALNRAQALYPAYKAQLQNAFFGGGQLTDEVRNEIAKLSMARYSIAARNAESIFKQYKGIAERNDLDLDSITIGASIPKPEIDIRPIQQNQAGQIAPLPPENELDMSRSDLPYYDIMLAWPTLSEQQRVAILNQLQGK